MVVSLGQQRALTTASGPASRLNGIHGRVSLGSFHSLMLGVHPHKPNPLCKPVPQYLIGLLFHEKSPRKKHDKDTGASVVERRPYAANARPGNLSDGDLGQGGTTERK
jgi:hypothetical protein